MMQLPLFDDAGVHALVDGQYGSTGKGALAAWLAREAITSGKRFYGAISNAGPNSGHTFYHNGEKHVLKQLPTFAVASYLLGQTIPVYMTAGAIIDNDILFDEANRYPGIPIYVHAKAVLVNSLDKERESYGTVAAVAGTQSGAGSALARKIIRDPEAVWEHWFNSPGQAPPNIYIWEDSTTLNGWEDVRYFMEVSQGFSLGIHSHFYPKVTSRECTVMQGIADARLPPKSVKRTYMSVRTFPIRVGNYNGYSSGGWYADQQEVSWADVGVVPELTTVTKRQRRIATFSIMQFMDALRANDPDFVFVNFLNYLTDEAARGKFITRIKDRGGRPVIGGYGPESKDIYVV